MNRHDPIRQEYPSEPGSTLRTKRQADLGQFLTPRHVADLLASFCGPLPQTVDLLEAGAGEGALTAALVRRACEDRRPPRRIRVTAFEIDADLVSRLRATLAECERSCWRAGIDFTSSVHTVDFIEAVVPQVRGELFAQPQPPFNLAIVNPPYRKIRSDSTARLLLRSAGIETVNLYAGFLALIIRLLVPGGQLVSITPRSFCNGPYFRRFRKDFLATMSPRRLHMFESRSAAFSGDEVLQENVIMHAFKEPGPPRTIFISCSSGIPGGPVKGREVPFHEVVRAGDREGFIHIPHDAALMNAPSAIRRLPATLDDLGLSVSTGRVVDFRTRRFLHCEPRAGSVPLIYPCHFAGGFVHWPKLPTRKANAIQRCAMTAGLLVPAGVYVLLKRFTAKEERRRLVACLYDPARVPADEVGFENHLNYYHANGRGLPINLAKGLAVFLNSTLTDLLFREFSGHTQVNATDLRILRYPSRERLERLGDLVDDPGLTQVETDELVEKELL
jgi:adenine-specific DNA-methyltransferase